MCGSPFLNPNVGKLKFVPARQQGVPLAFISTILTPDWIRKTGLAKVSFMFVNWG
jgi:hypothetical protein